MAKQERAVRTRENLIRSAAEVFDREGYAVASITTISARAGVSNGALHFHFASKAALAEAVAEAAALRLRDLVDQPPACGGLQNLVDTTHQLARELRDDVVLRAGFELGRDAGRGRRADVRGHWQNRVEYLLTCADRAGELRADVSTQVVATAVVATTAGFEVLARRDGDWLSRRTVARFWELLLPTLATTELLPVLDARGTH
ncbi:TetR family transcriptional regulator [Streptomyces sp. ID01-12c]|uniref:ScbR family autoregulator-binding transcription factor n=1 Tax=Streptomyces caniscabiei TaxID=2746961 RepID=UPI00177FAA92|nr:ScbR family autoregulator-binding transcription factor [Streptomyces caniscabiei]MBD9704183.1 TetR family transcriptional regulator [Streptomyces caniscabiei]MDX3733307.1 ScbR family autoregulator-binding transcription factor [Streptomyces caniscabiei]